MTSLCPLSLLSLSPSSLLSSSCFLSLPPSLTHKHQREQARATRELASVHVECFERSQSPLAFLASSLNATPPSNRIPVSSCGSLSCCRQASLHTIRQKQQSERLDEQGCWHRSLPSLHPRPRHIDSPAWQPDCGSDIHLASMVELSEIRGVSTAQGDFKFSAQQQRPDTQHGVLPANFNLKAAKDTDILASQVVPVAPACDAWSITCPGDARCAA